MKDAHEKQSTKSLPTRQPPWCGKGVREQNSQGKEVASQGLTADEAEVGYWSWKRENKVTKERQE